MTRISPDASAPRHRPRANGVKKLAAPNSALQRRCTASSRASYRRKTNAEPRSTMPIRTAVIGMCSAVMVAANPGGNAVKNTTITRMSQTWLASQIGPMACSIAARWRDARGPDASRSHMPPP